MLGSSRITAPAHSTNACGWVQAEQQAATAAQLGGGALVDQCHQLQADLMTCQQVGGSVGRPGQRSGVVV